jgi:hypothetical protein
MNKKLKQELVLLATAEDGATKEFFAVIRFRDIQGHCRKVNVPLAALDNAKGMHELLTNAGAYFVADKDRCIDALQSLRASRDRAKHEVFAPSLRWFKRSTFVRPMGVIGQIGPKQTLKPPRRLGK